MVCLFGVCLFGLEFALGLANGTKERTKRRAQRKGIEERPRKEQKQAMDGRMHDDDACVDRRTDG